MSNPPIYVTGTTPVVSINVGEAQYNAPIYVYLTSLPTKAGFTVTVRNNDGVPPAFRQIYVSTYSLDPDVTLKFSDGTDRIQIGTNAGDSFTTTVQNANTWLKEVTVIQGTTLANNENIIGYGTKISSMLVSSLITSAPLFVNLSSIFYGPLIGLISPTFVTSVSSLLFSTGILNTSNLTILEGLQTSQIIANTVIANSTFNANLVSSIYFTAQNAITSSITLFDQNLIRNPASLTTSNNALNITLFNNTSFTYATLEQSGFSNISTQIAPTIIISSNSSVSSLNTLVQTSLQSARWDTGLSSFSTATWLLLNTLGLNYGLTAIYNTFNAGITALGTSPGLSTIAMTTSIGLSTLAAVPGASNLSTTISRTLSSVSVHPGLSSLSTVLAPGLSSITAFVPISSLSSIISLGASTVNATYGIQNLSTILSYGLSSVAASAGLSSISTVYSIGISSIIFQPGLSSLSTAIFGTASTFQQGQVISTFSSLTSYGLSTISAWYGYSTLVSSVRSGLSSIPDTGYIPFSNDAGRITSTNITGFGLSSLYGLISTSFSTISDGPGISSISSFFPRSLSTMACGPGLSSLSTVISLGLSSIVTVLPFPPTYSTLSSIFSTLILRDFYSGSTATLFIQGEDLMISSMSTTSYQHYPQRLNYINSSTISTLVFEAKGSTLTSSIIVSSINLTSSFVAVGLDTKIITAQSTLVSSLFLTDYGSGSNTLFRPQGNTISLMVGTTLQPFLLVAATGLSSMSTSYGYAFQNLIQGIALSTVSTSISLGLSSIAIESGLQSVETYGNLKIDYNVASSISTLYTFTSTATISTLNTVSFSTSLISTLFVSAQQVNVSSFRTWNANISTFLPNLTSTTQVLGLLVTASSISTGTLVVSSIWNNPATVSSILYASSFFIYNNNAVISTVSANKVYLSTISFMGTGSTLFASSGQLYSLFQPVVGGSGTTSNGFYSFGSGGGLLDLFKNSQGISTQGLIASTIYVGGPNISTTSFFVGMTGTINYNSYGLQSTSYTCSFTVDVQGTISSGIFSTSMNEFRVRQSHGAQNWSYAAVNYNTTTSNTLSIQQPIGRVNDGTNRLFPNTTVMSYIGLSMPAGYTYALEWDGHKLLAGGYNSASGQAGSNLICYLPRYTWQNSNFQNAANPPTNTYNMWMAKYPTYVTSGFIAVYAIAYNGNQWIATGNAAVQAGTIKYSFDGLSWNNCASGGWVPDTTASSNTWAGGGGYCVKWNGYMWVCGGSNAAAGTGSGLQYSYDGINWTNTNLTTVGVMKKIVYFNNCVWVAAGTYADYGLKYSYDGINWTTCTVAGTTYSAPVICLEVNTNYIMYTNNNPSPLTATFRSYDGVNFTRPDAVGLLYQDPIFDGNNWLVNSAGFGTIVQNLTSNLNGGFGQYLSNATAANYTIYPACTHSNINPSMNMSNLKIYGSTFINIYNSTNTIVGFANSAYGGDGSNNAATGQGYNMHLERQNYLNINNILKIQQHLSSQVIIDSPGNPNAMAIANVNRFARATLDVLCTINVANATMFRGLKQMGAPAYPSSLGTTDQNYNVYIAGSSFLTNIAIGKGTGNSIFYNSGNNGPQSFFDVYSASTTFVTFRETTCNVLGLITNTGMKNLLNATKAPTVTCYPMMNSAGGANLTYFWKTQGNLFSNVDTTGGTFFTGQHPTNCLDIPFSNVDNYVGQLVSAIDQGYTAYTADGVKVTGSNAILTTNATPVTKITTVDKDPNVFGVVANMFNGIGTDGSLNLYTSTIFQTFLFDRIMVNALGEGAIWTTNYNGNITNGDYICSSPIPGLSRKQDDNRLWNYTVAKATMSCDFNPGYISAISTFVFENEVLSTFVSCLAYQCDSVVFNGSSFSTAFIGCTYHCS